MSASNVRNTSSAPTTSTLRPRNKRLISGLDDGDQDASTTSTIKTLPRHSSPVPGPYDHRSVSPIPSAHPQRSMPRRGDDASGTNALSNQKLDGRQSSNDSPTLVNLWGHSWNALQGIASDFLRTDESDAPKRKQRTRRPLSKLDSSHRSSNGFLASWGPSAPALESRPAGIGIGTREEQTAAFRAQKQMDMLAGKESSYADALGRFKRRLSDDRASASAPPGEDDRGALVYLHNVAKEDTLAGITIRYGISTEVLRKANRMWPNDTAQARDTLLVPVDACSVKGRPTTGPGEEIDLLTSENEALSTLQAEEVPTIVSPPNVIADSSRTAGRNRHNSTSTSTSVTPSVTATESAWHHDSWVLLPNSMKPTEIVRLPRRALGYFPPARRKSQSFSDLDTPSTSLDIRRQSNDAIGRHHVSPQRQTLPRRSGHGRKYSSAINGYYPQYLSGPGGVGTMSRDVRFPGPAQDGLNKLFAKHLPDVAPPQHQDILYHPDMPLYTDEPTPVPSGSATPAYPLTTKGHGNLNLENVGGAIESWVRRMASRAKVPSQDRQSAARASVGAPGKGVGGIGDLIEMTDEFEIGGDDEDMEQNEQRGRQSAPQVSPTTMSGSSSSTNYSGGTAKRSTKAIETGKTGKVD